MTNYLRNLGFASTEELDEFIWEQYTFFERMQLKGEQIPVIPISEAILDEDQGVAKFVIQLIREIKNPSPVQDPINRRGHSSLENFSDFQKYVVGKIQDLEYDKKAQPF